ncbi:MULTISPECIES: hypothetical protein [unclassified Herbaspirillum]|uniref:hypothetical protein n=1 Tax=unclassified Herbaspirillum TaxID=2624150 RepID=UPI000E2EDA4F|nr:MULTISPECIES: hypothetical protein [unclassified Herbaspirillum]RFB73841.1 hypothetical protein DZB54_06095 [Herbaspirillum sp. 3R-3a1]TFI10348.1 hypothetical protein E4P32_02080 [Herbaspirillum sp. 3R11]TFI16252.1 hypothetical protein E4P31_02085 [Herbaspirillum sp. 3R-11]TFI28349.1 hypothetical protein E4P30_08150 [Herbaspirillum sp. 3C11]
MNRIRQMLIDTVIAAVVILVLLVIYNHFHRNEEIERVTSAYKRGVSHGIMAARAPKLTPAVQAQLLDICKQSWPDTADGVVARQRACGATAPAKRSDQ